VKFKRSNSNSILRTRPFGLGDPTIFMACVCTAFMAREMALRSVGFLRGMVCVVVALRCSRRVSLPMLGMM
tara:strand:- start:882 stop:1094 length:213 start_codon:yes stop_codon:yes gene_type:complete